MFLDKNKIPRFDEMMKPLLEALKAEGGTAGNKELDNRTIKLMGIQDVAKIPHNEKESKQTEVAYRLSWARTYLKKYGVIENKVRGVWSFTESFDGDIKQIDPVKVVQYVKHETLSNDEEMNARAETESAQAFMKLVKAVLQERAEEQGKQIETEIPDYRRGYDVYLKEGIDSIQGPTFCIIKYLQDSDAALSSIIQNSLSKLKSASEKSCVLFVLNREIPVSFREKLCEETLLPEGIQTIILWDKLILDAKINPEADYTNYMLAPRRAVMEDVIFSRTSEEEKLRKRQQHMRALREAYENEDIFLFLGAGVSIDAGVPLWSGLIKKLFIRMIDTIKQTEKLSKEEKRLLETLAYQNKEDSPLTQVRYIKCAFSDEEYYQVLHSVLYENDLNPDTEMLKAIAKISSPSRARKGVRGIVTYNFDDLLERKLVERDIEFTTIYCENNRPSTDNLNIYHVHGYLPGDLNSVEKNSDLVFSEEDYHRVYRDAYSWSNLTQVNAFRNNTCLFIGSSLTDPNMRRLLDVAARNKEEVRHYAFLKKNRPDEKAGQKELLKLYQEIDDNVRASYFQQLGIHIIWVDDYSEIPELLLSLRK